jgi:hypothetical protein
MTEIAQPIPIRPRGDARRQPVTVTTVPPERAQLVARPRPAPVVVDAVADEPTLRRMSRPVRGHVAIGAMAAGGLFATATLVGYAGVAAHALGAAATTVGAVMVALLIVLAVVNHRRHCPGCSG